MENLKLCPKCGHLMYYDSYFHSYCCNNSECSYMERKETEASQLDRIEKKLDAILRRLEV